ncbi:MAG: DASS family sodium-coupled anion symporter, partial [Sporomusa sp.]
MMNNNLVKGILTVLVGVAIWFLPPPPGLKPEALHLFAIFVAVILGFILKPLPMGAVAFIGISFTAFGGVLKFNEALSGFANSTIWLIVAAFLFAKGFIKTGLGRRIAYVIMRAIGDSTLKIGYTLVLTNVIIGLATPSSTARVGGVLYPIVRGLSSAFGSEPGATARKMGAYLIQLMYQVDTITCAMFLTAMAGNPLIALLAAKTLQVEITWSLWAQAAIVPGIVSLVTTPYLLYKIFPPEITKTPEAKELAAKELEKSGPMSFAEKMMALVFISALVLWVMNQINATIVALLGVSAMLITKVIDWKDVTSEEGAWDTLVWMGTLVSLASGLVTTGFIPWFAKAASASIEGISWISAFFVLLLIYVYAHY